MAVYIEFVVLIDERRILMIICSKYKYNRVLNKDFNNIIYGLFKNIEYIFIFFDI